MEQDLLTRAGNQLWLLGVEILASGFGEQVLF